MPENTTTEIVTAEVVTELPEPIEQDQLDTDDQDTDADTAKAGAEAAKYRARLRATEAERDGLATRLEALQRSEITRLASKELLQGEAIWASGKTVADLIDDDGNIDREKVKAAATEAAERFGLKPALTWPRSDPSQGATGNQVGRGESSWQKILAQ
ncbi:hypothetical protein EH165_09780 [Nakamurella antarctica]|uniref:Scaffolding protein n=1 Tax=Nakamurella antarctica TaxID=1902245 RepID=A0A3G8ZWL0_9ACTN|nr:hypothetical protein [Nakamurella antarctica]AZI58386.1 hypothetical protein EH165_09780 [Nakamurella antarctica]